MTSPSQPRSTYVPEMLAEVHNKYDRGLPGTDSIYVMNLSHCWLPLLAFLSAAEDGCQKMTLVWPVDSACTRRRRSTEMGGSERVREKSEQMRRQHQPKLGVLYSPAGLLAGIVIFLTYIYTQTLKL